MPPFHWQFRTHCFSSAGHLAITAKFARPDIFEQRVAPGPSSGSACQFGFEHSPLVWAVLFDLGSGDNGMNIAVLEGGNVNLYRSMAAESTAHELHRADAWRLCSLAASHLSATDPTDDFRYPGTGQVRIYFLTRSGVRAATTNTHTIEDQDQPFSKLFAVARHIFYEPRLAPVDSDAG